MQSERKGERLGWLGGWAGGFLWVLLLSLVFLFTGRVIAGVAGLLLVGVAGAAIVCFAPWRHPLKEYWKLMLPIYACLGLSVGWALWAYSGDGGLMLNWWDSVWMVLLLLPIINLGKRKWGEGGGA